MVRDFLVFERGCLPKNETFPLCKTKKKHIIILVYIVK